ncbi:MAG: hypothetical protein FJX52_13425, partial [Alphaproteobacteria bacterium]|nr:hypothetical protein [Alphaproteobacteria bacterium]
ADLGRRCYLIAEGGSRSFLSGLDLTNAAAAGDADFLLVVGIDAPRKALADYDDVLDTGLGHGLPMLCANGDLVRIVAGALHPAPGALARHYEERGGVVRWYGKPLRSIFEASLAKLTGIPAGRVLVLGDSLEHDIAGAAATGLGSIYIRGGINADHSDGVLQEEMARLGVRPTYCAPGFQW